MRRVPWWLVGMFVSTAVYLSSCAHAPVTPTSPMLECYDNSDRPGWTCCYIRPTGGAERFASPVPSCSERSCPGDWIGGGKPFRWDCDPGDR